MQCPTALCDCKKSGWLVSGGALYFGEWAVETDCVGKPCEFWAELIRRFSSTDVTINIVILFFSCEELNVQIVSVLNLMDITSKFWIITVFFFSIVDLQIIFYPYCVGMFMVCLCIGGIMVYHQTESKRKFSHRADVLLFTLPKLPQWRKFYYNTLFQDRDSNVASLPSTQFCTSFMLLLIVGYKKVKWCGI